MTGKITMRLSPPDPDDKRKWRIVGYHGIGQYPIYEEVTDELDTHTDMDEGTVYERGEN